MSTTYRKRKIKYKRKKNLKMTTIKSCQYRKIMSRTRGKIPTTTGHKKKRERERKVECPEVPWPSYAKYSRDSKPVMLREKDRHCCHAWAWLWHTFRPITHSIFLSSSFASSLPPTLSTKPLLLQKFFFFFLDINAITHLLLSL